jgi:hypothetical protein
MRKAARIALASSPRSGIALITDAMCLRNLSRSRGANGRAADMIAVISESLKEIGVDNVGA